LSVWNLHPLDGLQVFPLGPGQAPYPAGDRSAPSSLAPTLHHFSRGLMEGPSRQFNENALSSQEVHNPYETRKLSFPLRLHVADVWCCRLRTRTDLRAIADYGATNTRP